MSRMQLLGRKMAQNKGIAVAIAHICNVVKVEFQKQTT